MSRKPISEKAMTPAERQRRRRARLRAENPPSKPGRPRHNWIETDQSDKLLLLIGASPSKRRAKRRHYAATVYRDVAAYVLGIDKGEASYSPEAEERYKRLNKKTILEALGRYGIYARRYFGLEVEEVYNAMRYWADDLIKEGDELSAESVVQFFRAIRMMRGSDAVY